MSEDGNGSRKSTGAPSSERSAPRGGTNSLNLREFVFFFGRLAAPLAPNQPFVGEVEATGGGAGEHVGGDTVVKPRQSGRLFLGEQRNRRRSVIVSVTGSNGVLERPKEM